MHEVTPKVFMIAHTSLDEVEYREMLTDIGAKDWQIGKRPADGEALVEIAGRMCYKAFGTELNKNITKVREGNKDYLGNILKQQHGSVLEHATVTFALIDVSRILTHELVRHRPGMAYSQESGRFVRVDDIGMYYPQVFRWGFLQEFAPYSPAHSRMDDFGRTMTQEEWARARGENLWGRMTQIVEMIEDFIKDQSEVLGLNNPKMPFHMKKVMTSALRRIAPNGMSNNIVVTGNHRAWRYLIENRTSLGAEEEIQLVFGKIARKLQTTFPNMYQDLGDPVDGVFHFQNPKV